jgi:hypothetical protein
MALILYKIKLVFPLAEVILLTGKISDGVQAMKKTELLIIL